MQELRFLVHPAKSMMLVKIHQADRMQQHSLHQAVDTGNLRLDLVVKQKLEK